MTNNSCENLAHRIRWAYIALYIYCFQVANTKRKNTFTRKGNLPIN